MGGPSAQRRPHSGRPQFEGGRPEDGPAAQARRPGRPIGPPDFRGWPPTFGRKAARFWSEGRPIWRLGGPGGGRAARSPLTADSTTDLPDTGSYLPTYLPTYLPSKKNRHRTWLTLYFFNFDARPTVPLLSCRATVRGPGRHRTGRLGSGRAAHAPRRSHATPDARRRQIWV